MFVWVCFIRSCPWLFVRVGGGSFGGCYIFFGPTFICIGVDMVLVLVLYLRSLISLRRVGAGSVFLLKSLRTLLAK